MGENLVLQKLTIRGIIMLLQQVVVVVDLLFLHQLAYFPVLLRNKLIVLLQLLDEVHVHLAIGHHFLV